MASCKRALSPISLRRQSIAFLLSLVLPLSVCLAWGLKNHAYPNSDPVGYFFPAQKIYLSHPSGPLQWLRALYLERDTPKPVILPVAGAMALLLSGGKVLAAVRLSGALFLTMLLFFSFLGFNLVLPTAQSVLATSLIGILPWCVHSARFFDIEIAGLAFSAAALYWLVRSWNLSSRKSAWMLGSFLGVGLCLRPTDILLFLFAPLAFWMARNLRDGKLRFRDVLVAGVIILPFLFFFFGSPIRGPVGVVTLCLPCVALFLARKKIGPNSPFLITVSTSYLMMSLWYFPYMRELHFWMVDCGYGANAQHARLIHPISRLGFLFTFLKELGGFPLLLFGLASVIPLAKPSNSRPPWRALAVGCFGIFTPILIGAITANPSTRYYYPSAFLLNFLLIAYALNPSSRLRWVRGLLIVVAFICCLTWNVQATWFPGLAHPLSDNPVNDYRMTQTSPLLDSDPNKRFLDVLQTAVASAQAISSPVSFSLPRGVSFESINEETLFVVAREMGVGWNFNLNPTPECRRSFPLSADESSRTASWRSNRPFARMEEFRDPQCV